MGRKHLARADLGGRHAGAIADLPVENFAPINPELIDGAQLSLPSLAGLTPEEAVKRLDALDLRSEVSETEVASYQAKGTVAYTSPGEGSTVQPGATVTLYLSNGVPPPPEPDPSEKTNGGKNDGGGGGGAAEATPETAVVRARLRKLRRQPRWQRQQRQRQQRQATATTDLSYG